MSSSLSDFIVSCKESKAFLSHRISSGSAAPLGERTDLSSIWSRNDEVGSWWEAGDQRAWVHCSGENWGLEETRCAKCLGATLLLMMNSSEAKKNNTVHCRVACVIVLCGYKYWQEWLLLSPSF